MLRDPSHTHGVAADPANVFASTRIGTPKGGDHFRHNVQEIATRVASRPILAVIKNNGYGLGVANAGRALEPLDAIAGLAVVKLNEAVALREAGIRKPVLLMGPFDERDLEEAVSRDIMPMVYTPIGDVLDQVRIGDASYPIIAAISASHTIVEIGAEERVRAGDVATIFDWEDGSRPEDLSAACGCSVYDLMMHLSPMMPRTVT